MLYMVFKTYVYGKKILIHYGLVYVAWQNNVYF